MQETVEVRLNEWLSAGFQLYKDNFGVLVLASLIAVVLTGVTLGILAGPMFAGLVLIVLRLHDRSEPAPKAGDVFQGFQHFLQAFLFWLVSFLVIMVGSFILNIIPILGQIASFALSWVVMSFLMFGLFLIVDRGMEFWPAALESINMVKKNFWNFLLFGVLTAVIGSAGIILCGIGMALTVPIQLCAVAAAYREIYGGGAKATAQAAPQA